MNIGMIIIALILMAGVFGGSNFYVGKRILQTLAFLLPNINRPAYIVAYVLIASSFIFGRAPLLPVAIKGIFDWIGAHWMGMLIYLLLFFFIADMILLIGNAVKPIPAHILPSVNFYAGAAAILLAVGVVCYGLHNAARMTFVSYDVQLKRDLSEKMNIVLIADLHLGDINSEKRLESIVRGINSLNPDIVCIAGDIFNDYYHTIRDPNRASELLKSIKTAHGVYASLGNHDGGSTLNEMTGFLERSNIKLLNDEHVVIDGRLVLIGRLDGRPIGGFGEMKRKDFSEVIARADVNLPIAVMDHNPANIDEYGDEVDLILAGHTHRGQLFPGSLFTRAIFTVDYGRYQKNSGSPHVIVTQGVHTWMMPMRVGTNNEIVSVMAR